MANPQTITIFVAAAVNGQGTIVKTVERADKVETEPVSIQIAGTWEGVTVNVQASLDSGTTFTNCQKIKDDGTLVDVVITADGFVNIAAPSGAQLTLNISGVGGTPPSLNAWALGNIVSVP